MWKRKRWKTWDPKQDGGDERDKAMHAGIQVQQQDLEKG